jgi:hypothetical protein
VILNTELIEKYALSIDKHCRKHPGLDNLITATGLKDLDVLLRNLSPTVEINLVRGSTSFPVA